MKVILWIIALLLIASSVAAYGWMHEQFLEDRTYDDLVEYREQTARQIMPWIQSEQDFQQVKEQHKLRESFSLRRHCGRW